MFRHSHNSQSCEEWLNEIQANVFSVVHENFGDATLETNVPTGFRSIAVKSGKLILKVVLYCPECLPEAAPSFESDAIVIARSSNSLTDGDIYKLVYAKFRKQV